MHVGQKPSLINTCDKPSILLMDANSERRALRKKIMALYGIEVVGACDLTGRDEIKKEKPQQIVVFVVGKPKYIELNPLAGPMSSKSRMRNGKIPCAKQSGKAATLYRKGAAS